MMQKNLTAFMADNEELKSKVKALEKENKFLKDESRDYKKLQAFDKETIKDLEQKLKEKLEPNSLPKVDPRRVEIKRLDEQYKKKEERLKRDLGDIKRKFKRMTLREKKSYIKQKEFEMQKVVFEKKMRSMKRSLDDATQKPDPAKTQRMPQTESIMSMKQRNPVKYSNDLNAKEIESQMAGI